MNNKVKIILGILILAALIGAYLGRNFICGNTSNEKNTYIYIKTGSDFNALLTAIAPILKNKSAFENVAAKMNLSANVNPGRYQVTPNMSNFKLVKMLRSGNQKPVKLVLNKYRMKKDVIRKICTELEADSNELLQLLNNNTYLSQWGLDSNTAIGAFTPNTYELYWNSNAKKVFEKLVKAYTKIWTDDNKAKAKQLNLSPSQVMTLASIVDEETNANDEKGNIASVYLNRLKQGMKLQADPTAKYAYGDFTIKRVLNKHIQFPSPYNTYYLQGLPPGPICTPKKESIAAVLNAPSTSYLYFCAKEDFSGRHNFATNGAEHLANAKKFQDAMNARGIKH
ncbi:MAG: endolytic transglycosylase MltG [Chitinophagaceae bacterium]|nr:endolytic transglycosylase MltG [Chitinophagaceae bacterium]